MEQLTSISALCACISAMLLGLWAWEANQRLEALESQQPGAVTTILVGQDCLGATGPNRIAIALEEDELPQCEIIDVHEIVLR